MSAARIETQVRDQPRRQTARAAGRVATEVAQLETAVTVDIGDVSDVAPVGIDLEVVDIPRQIRRQRAWLRLGEIEIA